MKWEFPRSLPRLSRKQAVQLPRLLQLEVDEHQVQCLIRPDGVEWKESVPHGTPVELYRLSSVDRVVPEPRERSGRRLRSMLIQELRAQPAWLRFQRGIYFTPKDKATFAGQRVRPFGGLVARWAAGKRLQPGTPVHVPVGEDEDALSVIFALDAKGVPVRHTITPDVSEYGVEQATIRLEEESGLEFRSRPVDAPLSEIFSAEDQRAIPVYPLDSEWRGIPKDLLANGAAAAGVVALLGAGGLFVWANGYRGNLEDRLFLAQQALANQSDSERYFQNHVLAVADAQSVPYEWMVDQARRIWIPGTKVVASGQAMPVRNGRGQKQVTLQLHLETERVGSPGAGLNGDWPNKAAMERLLRINPPDQFNLQSIQTGTHGTTTTAVFSAVTD